LDALILFFILNEINIPENNFLSENIFNNWPMNVVIKYKRFLSGTIQQGDALNFDRDHLKHELQIQ